MQGSLISSVFLVLNNAKLDILDSESRSALDCAQIAKQRSIEDWLSKKGAIRSVTKEIQQVEEPAVRISEHAELFYIREWLLNYLGCIISSD